MTKEHEGTYKCLITNEPDMLTQVSDAKELQLGVLPLECKYNWLYFLLIAILTIIDQKDSC